MTDSVIQIPADGIGKKVDTDQVLRPDGVLVEQQKIKIPDDTTIYSLLEQILIELRVNNKITAIAFNISKIDSLRNPETF
jgi:hypothetical protein